jgi:hypothetical protein
MVRCLALLDTTQPQEAPRRVNGPKPCSLIAEWLLEQFPDLLMTVEAMIAEGYPSHPAPLRGDEPRGSKRRDTADGQAFCACQRHWVQVAEQKLVEHWVTREDLSPYCSWGFFALPVRRFPRERNFSPNLLEGVFFRS